MLREESRGWNSSPAHHRSESQLSIPRRGALQRSSSPLPQPPSFSRARLKRSTINQRTVLFNTADCFTFGVHRNSVERQFPVTLLMGTNVCETQAGQLGSGYGTQCGAK